MFRLHERLARGLAAAIAAASIVRGAPADVVKVDGGEVSGVADRGVRVFKGMPYAAPPVGPLRWKAPQPIVAWSGVRDGSAFGAECPQTQYPA